MLFVHLLYVCRISNGGSPGSTIHYNGDLSRVESIREGYCDPKCNELKSDEVISCAFQEENLLLPFHLLCNSCCLFVCF